MKQLSISFTLGRESKPNSINLSHNNRDFIAKNVDVSKIKDNISYISEDVEEAYSKLFGEALAEYNAKQNRSDRKIDNYYYHILKSKREEAFYEAIVQFGDIDTARCGSDTGEKCKEMLTEYLHQFKNNNPNLYVFNAVQHLDEATPHLHIDFIPFYTKGRTNGLSKGVSMKAALNEQGFTAKNYKENRLVAWEESERNRMEKILNVNGFERDDKEIKHRHMTVDEYKSYKDDMHIAMRIKEKIKATPDEIKTNNFKEKIYALENENKKLKKEKFSPYKSFFYSSPDKQAFVQAQLDLLSITYRETDNGFEAQECYAEQIRKIEKQFKTPNTTAREKLRDDIDRLLMRSNSLDELLEKLQKEKYEIKRGKYLAVKPQYGTNFLRLKSLGEQYSEYALINRLNAKKKYEFNLNDKINKTPQENKDSRFVLKTMQFYIITYSKGALPMKRKFNDKVYSWSNDAELNQLAELNQKLNSGANLDSLRYEFESKEHDIREKEEALAVSKAHLQSFYNLKEKILMVFENKKSDRFTLEQAQKTLQKYPNITSNNYKRVDLLIENEINAQKRLELELKIAREDIKKSAEMYSLAEKIVSGTYIQELVNIERQKRESNFIPNGYKSAD